MNQVAIIAALSNLLVEATDKCDKLESDLRGAKQDYLWAQEDLDASHREQHRLHEAAASRKISDDQLYAFNKHAEQRQILMSLFSRPEVFVNIRTYMETADPWMKIANIKAVRTLTGWGLKEAKDFVEAFHWAPIETIPVPELPIQKTIGEIIKEKLGESK